MSRTVIEDGKSVLRVWRTKWKELKNL
jgi:hypothetical protein